ncbi:MAG: hypothetical protein ACLVJH_08735 [Faecalibacterium prausnitzii]
MHPDGGAAAAAGRQTGSCPCVVQTESVMAIRVCDGAVQLSPEPETPDTGYAGSGRACPETDPALVKSAAGRGLCAAAPGGSVRAAGARQGQRDQHRAQGRADHAGTPCLLSKDGLTAAEMGTALHAFLEHADFASLAAAKAAGTLEEAILTERQRQVDMAAGGPGDRGKLDASRIRRFVEGEAFAKICAAEKVLRELAFITALPASGRADGAEELPRRKPLPCRMSRCWCRASQTLCWCSRIIWNCWITRPTAARPKADF